MATDGRSMVRAVAWQRAGQAIIWLDFLDQSIRAHCPCEITRQTTREMLAILCDILSPECLHWYQSWRRARYPRSLSSAKNAASAIYRSGQRTGCMGTIRVCSEMVRHNPCIDNMLELPVFWAPPTRGGACQMRAKSRLVALILTLRARSIMSSRTRR